MRDAAVSIARRLQDAGHVAYFAGGCVRDELLGNSPKDYDIATSATPQQVQDLFPKSQSVGAHFGVIIVRENKVNYEIATFRTDGSYKDGRRPEKVTFATAEEDARRRDFTVNGIFLDPVCGRVFDYVNGQDDLSSRTLRAIGDPADRFQEDHLRLMRTIRFAAVLGFEIAPQTWQAVCDHSNCLSTISIERVREELVKILHHANRLNGFDLLNASGLLRLIIPEMEDLKGCTQPPQFHPEGDVWVHTRLMLSLLPQEVTTALVFSVLLHDIAKPATWTCDPLENRIRFNGHDKLGAEMTGVIMRRLKFSNNDVAATVEAVANHMKFMHVQEMLTAKLKRFIARPNFPNELALHRVDCLGSHRHLDNFEFLVTKQEQISNAPVLPPWYVNGYDLMQAGYPTGKALKTLLTAVHDAQLEGAVTSKEEAMAWILQSFPPGG